MNVRQYDPVRKKWLEENNADRFLKEHIMRGDRGDGVPNFLSRDDCFVLNTRQKPLTTKKIDLWVTLDPQVFCDENMLRGWKRNEQMIDLNFIPTNIRTSVIESYNNQKGKGRDQLFTYFVEHKLKNLLPDIDQF
jgi:hypothetical protein